MKVKAYLDLHKIDPFKEKGEKVFENVEYVVYNGISQILSIFYKEKRERIKYVVGVEIEK